MQYNKLMQQFLKIKSIFKIPNIVKYKKRHIKIPNIVKYKKRHIRDNR